MCWRVLALPLYLHTSIHTPIPKQRTDVSKYHNNDSADALWEMPCDTSVASADLWSLFHEKKKVDSKEEEVLFAPCEVVPSPSLRGRERVRDPGVKTEARWRAQL